MPCPLRLLLHLHNDQSLAFSPPALLCGLCISVVKSFPSFSVRSVSSVLNLLSCSPSPREARERGLGGEGEILALHSRLDTRHSRLNPPSLELTANYLLVCYNSHTCIVRSKHGRPPPHPRKTRYR